VALDEHEVTKIFERKDEEAAGIEGLSDAARSNGVKNNRFKHLKGVINVLGQKVPGDATYRRMVETCGNLRDGLVADVVSSCLVCRSGLALDPVRGDVTSVVLVNDLRSYLLPCYPFHTPSWQRWRASCGNDACWPRSSSST